MSVSRSDVDAVAPLVDVFAIANVAFEDVDVQVARQLLRRIGLRIERHWIDPLVRPPVENLLQVLHCRSLERHSRFGGGLDQGPCDRSQPIGKQIALSEALLVLVGEQHTDLAGKLEKRPFESRVRRLLSRHDRGLEGCEGRRTSLSRACEDLLQSKSAARSDRGQVPEDITEFFDDGAGVSEIRGPITLFLFNFAEKAARFPEEPEQRERQRATVASLVGGRGERGVARDRER